MSEQELTEAADAHPGQSGGEAGGQPGQQAGTADWEQDPAFRKIKSKYDQQIAAAQQRAQYAEAQLRSTQSEVQLTRAEMEQLQRYVSEFDPEAGESFLREAEVNVMRQKLAAYEQREQQEQAQAQAQLQAYQYHVEMARSLGVDPSDPRFQEALNTGINENIERVRAEIYAEMKAPQKKETVVAEQPEQPTHDNVVLPGSGGSAPDPNDRLMQEFEARKKNIRPGDIPGLFELRREYRAKGLNVSIDGFEPVEE
jgi:hypothetical protein